jgi:FkbM family methyltransferase
MVHAGAFFGDMLPSFSRHVSGMVLAFEPVLENFVLSKLCVEANSLENVMLFNNALGDSFCNLKLNTGKAGLHAGGASSVSNAGQLCAAMPLDVLGDRTIAMIHLDIEGHELPALEGAREIIKESRPIVLIEDNKNACGELLVSMNYRHLADIPGLKIWSPVENEAYRRIVDASVG